jgi:hypothetical protein
VKLYRDGQRKGAEAAPEALQHEISISPSSAAVGGYAAFSVFEVCSFEK